MADTTDVYNEWNKCPSVKKKQKATSTFGSPVCSNKSGSIFKENTWGYMNGNDFECCTSCDNTSSSDSTSSSACKKNQDLLNTACAGYILAGLPGNFKEWERTNSDGNCDVITGCSTNNAICQYPIKEFREVSDINKFADTFNINQNVYTPGKYGNNRDEANNKAYYEDIMPSFCFQLHDENLGEICRSYPPAPDGKLRREGCSKAMSISPEALPGESSGDLCRNWIAAMEQAGGAADGVVDSAFNSFCSKNPTLPECDCISRGDIRNPENVVYRTTGAQQLNEDACWWGPCKNPQSYLVPSSMMNPNCPDTVQICNTITTNIASTGGNIDNVPTSIIDCQQDYNGNRGNGDNGDNGGEGIPSWVWLVIVGAVLLIIFVVIIIIIIIAVSGSKSKKKSVNKTSGKSKTLQSSINPAQYSTQSLHY